MLEAQKHGKPSVVWLVHGSQLIRAAPEHLRHDHLSQEQPLSPSQALDSVRGRGTTTYLDLTNMNRHIAARGVHTLDSDDEEAPEVKSRRIEVPPDSTAPAVIPEPLSVVLPAAPNATATAPPLEHLSPVPVDDVLVPAPEQVPLPHDDSPC